MIMIPSIHKQLFFDLWLLNLSLFNLLGGLLQTKTTNTEFSLSSISPWGNSILVESTWTQALEKVSKGLRITNVLLFKNRTMASLLVSKSARRGKVFDEPVNEKWIFVRKLFFQSYMRFQITRVDPLLFLGLARLRLLVDPDAFYRVVKSQVRKEGRYDWFRSRVFIPKSLRLIHSFNSLLGLLP